MAATGVAAGGEGVFLRRAEFDDNASILALLGEEEHLYAKRFGKLDVTWMIENASLGVSAVDAKGSVVGYAAFFDYPALTPSISAPGWPAWLHKHFLHEEYSPSNTIFLSFFVADHLCENEVTENILRTAFTTLPDIDAVLFVLPSDVRLFSPLRETFEPLECLEPDKTDFRVFACPRGLYLPNLLIRDARVEDHDDLVPVFNAQSDVLTERYGEFFIAELIESQDASNKCVLQTPPCGPQPGLAAAMGGARLSQLCSIQAPAFPPPRPPVSPLYHRCLRSTSGCWPLVGRLLLRWMATRWA